MSQLSTVSRGVPGSIRWGIDNERAYDVKGVQFTYGQQVTDADNHRHAASIALYKGPNYSTWLPNGTILGVWRVGPQDYMRSEYRGFIVQSGEALPLPVCSGHVTKTNTAGSPVCQNCGISW